MLGVPRWKAGRDHNMPLMKQGVFLSGAQTLEKLAKASWSIHPEGLVGCLNAHGFITRMFIEALFIITKSWHPLACPAAEE